MARREIVVCDRCGLKDCLAYGRLAVNVKEKRCPASGMTEKEQTIIDLCQACMIMELQMFIDNTSSSFGEAWVRRIASLTSQVK